ncbi:MFS transporter, partial [Pseudomonas sp. NDM]
MLQGISLMADRPDLGLGIPILLLALGQNAGTPIFGVVQEAAGAIDALGV